jgi:uncharacterized membrane protein
MSYATLTWIHLATVVPAFLVGTYLLLNRKGTPVHRALGKLFMILMLGTAFVALFMSDGGGTRLFGHFGFNHLFVIPVAIFIPRAYFAARRGDIRTHKASMIGVYAGALLIAGAVAIFTPGRLLHVWLFEEAAAQESPDVAHWLHEACGITFAQAPVIAPNTAVTLQRRKDSMMVASATVVLPDSEIASVLESLRNDRTLHSRGQSDTRYSYESYPDARPGKACELDTSQHVLYFSYAE